MFAVLLLVIGAALLNGPARIPLRELLLQENRQILNLRLLRVLAAISVGSGLTVCGMVLQAILRNSLAEPYLLGTSSGAGLAAVIAVSIGVSGLYLPFLAFFGAIISIIIVYCLAREQGRVRPESLILSGVVVSIAFHAIMVFVVSISKNEAIYGLAWWLWGSLQVLDPGLLFSVSFVVFSGVCLIYLFAQDLNAISLGEEEAVHLGVRIETVKKILIALVALITSCLVSICGIIGFVGLIVPHMMRLSLGSNHKVLIPIGCLAASIFMITCDIISRSVAGPLEVPIGIITALIGAPLFFILFKRQQKAR